MATAQQQRHPVDADIVIEATGQVIGTFAKLIRRHEYGEPDRCPRCESYRMRQEVETDEEQMGFWESRSVRPAAGNRSRSSPRSMTILREAMWPAISPAQASGFQTGSIRNVGKTE